MLMEIREELIKYQPNQKPPGNPQLGVKLSFLAPGSQSQAGLSLARYKAVEVLSGTRRTPVIHPCCPGVFYRSTVRSKLPLQPPKAACVFPMVEDGLNLWFIAEARSQS